MNYSYSAISSFKSCPKAFKYKYIDKTREAFVSVERYMGSCVHEVLHWAYLQRLDGKDPGIHQVGQEYDIRWQGGEIDRVRVIKPEASLDDYFNTGFTLLSGFFQNVFPGDKSETLHLEHQFELTLEDRFPYRGIIDRISRQPEGVIRVTDFKTGTVSHPLDNFQLPSYALYVFHHYDEDTIELCLEDLATPRTIVTRFEKRQGKDIESEIGREIDAINRAASFPANPGILCSWCGYNTICTEAPKSIKKDLPEENPPALSGEESEKGDKRFCPECGGLLKERQGKFGPFWGCSNYPQCRYTLDIRKSEGLAGSGAAAEEICPECGGTLRKRKGKFGPFWGCSNYPECRFTRKIK